ncbi:MAG: 2-dehydro-3-deoxyglucarate aldolase [Verrucomicrobia bacterium]|nr:2-dehydro-3-deoxyglucarate aldolase [Verrucomicrobiota bacterium]
MKKNFVREKLKRGEASLGTWLTLPCPVAARMMAGVGFDWLTVETEHSPISIETAAAQFISITAGGCAPFVRLPMNTTENIKRVLDTGAWGVIVPLVNTRAEAEAVVEAARYAPLGSRTIGGQMHAINFETAAANYYEKANDEILVVVMIEQAKGVENAEAILSVPGIDAVFIGPNDLHQSYGLKPVFESDAPQFVEALQHVRTTAKKHGVAPGLHVIDAATAQRRMAEGFQFIAVGSDAGMMLGKANETAKALGLSGKSAIKY